MTTKYRAKPTTYNGVAYPSKAEAQYAEVLDTLVAAGEVRWWLRQPAFRLGPVDTYRADFLVLPAEGREYVVDVKGMETRKFRRDMKAWLVCGPPVRLVVVKRVGDKRFKVTHEIDGPTE